MKTITFKAQKRDSFGKKGSKALRREGLVPCVIYGSGETLHFYVSEKELGKIIYTPESYIIEFDIEGHTEYAVMRETQFHPVSDELLHIDFYRVVEHKPVSIDVPIRIVGTSEGVKLGGKLMVAKRKLRISAEKQYLPDVLDVDITNVPLGGSVFVGDLSYDHISILTPATTAICAVKMTRAARGAAK